MGRLRTAECASPQPYHSQSTTSGHVPPSVATQRSPAQSAHGQSAPSPFHSQPKSPSHTGQSRTAATPSPPPLTPGPPPLPPPEAWRSTPTSAALCQSGAPRVPHEARPYGRLLRDPGARSRTRTPTAKASGLRDRTLV
ncbi:hypothetical protein VTO73DRAFT_6046 [Trametes versicolor]